MLDLGYNPRNVMSYRVTLPDSRYADAAAYDAFFGRLFAQLARIPGVADVAASGNVPLNGGSSAGLAIDGQAMPTRLPEVGYQSVSDAYFQTLQIPLQAGRTFDPRDRDEVAPVAIISAGVARRFWGDANPLGARIRLGPDPSEPWSTVVGVVGDIRRGVAGDVMPTVYVSSRQDQWSSNAVLIRTTGEPTSVLPAVREVMKSIDPTLAIQRPVALTEDRTNMLSDRRVPMQLLSAFGAIALALAGLGMFGTMAYSVATRTREIGLRVALGAQPREVLGLIVRQGLLIWAIGIAVGVVLSIALGRGIASILYETEPTDPVTIASVAVILMVVTLAGCVIPARRALRVDPIVALRAE
jgi:predicted permease